MSTACLIGRPTGPTGLKAVYCHWDGNPTDMAPVLRRLVLDTFQGRADTAADYLFAYGGSGYWSSLTGSGVPCSAASRADKPHGRLHRSSGERWPADVDIYQDDPACRAGVLELRDGAWRDSPLLAWPQQWLYILYPRVLAVVRYLPPADPARDPQPHGINCAARSWSEPVIPDRLLELEQRVERRLSEPDVARRSPSGRTVAA